MKFTFPLIALFFTANVFASGFTCTRTVGNNRTDVTIFDGKYIVRYAWSGHFPTEEHFQGTVTAETIHDSITNYTLHDFINPGSEIVAIHYGVVMDFEDQRLDCRDLP